MQISMVDVIILTVPETISRSRDMVVPVKISMVHMT